VIGLQSEFRPPTLAAQRGRLLIRCAACDPTRWRHIRTLILNLLSALILHKVQYEFAYQVHRNGCICELREGAPQNADTGIITSTNAKLRNISTITVIMHSAASSVS